MKKFKDIIFEELNVEVIEVWSLVLMFLILD